MYARRCPYMKRGMIKCNISLRTGIAYCAVHLRIMNKKENDSNKTIKVESPTKQSISNNYTNDEALINNSLFKRFVKEDDEESSSESNEDLKSQQDFSNTPIEQPKPKQVEEPIKQQIPKKEKIYIGIEALTDIDELFDYFEANSDNSIKAKNALDRLLKLGHIKKPQYKNLLEDYIN